MATLRYDIIGTNASLKNVVTQSVSSLTTLEQAANKANKAIANEITPINELQKAVTNLNKNKLNIVDVEQLGRQNRLIKELKAEIDRLGNAGTIGFDKFGNKVKETTGDLTQLGKGLTQGLGYLRIIAYVLPGIGIAGIFNLAFEAISKATTALDLFNTKLTPAQNNLNNLNEVNKNAAKDLAEQSTKLRILYEATQDITSSIKDRTLAARELQKEFPDTFKNIQTEIILNGGASDSYKQLTIDIQENAKARSAANKIIEIEGKRLELQYQRDKVNSAKFSELSKVTGNFVIDPGLGAPKQTITVDAQRKAIKNRADLANAELKLQDDILKQQVDFLTKYAGGNTKIAKAISTGNTPALKSTVSGENVFASISSALDDIFNKTRSLANQSGLEGYALEVQKVVDKYIALNKQIDDNVAKAVKSNGRAGGISNKELDVINGKADRDRKDADRAKEKELSDLKIKEAERVSNEIQRINNEFGIKAEQSRGRELASIQKKYDDEVVKAKGNTEILASIDSGRVSAIQALNDKYAAIEADLWSRIEEIDLSAQATLLGREETRTDRIRHEWEERLKAANTYFEKLKLIAASEANNIFVPGLGNLDLSKAVTGAISNKQQTVGENITNAGKVAVFREEIKPFTDAISQGLSSATKNVFTLFTTLNEQADQSFTALFSSFVNGVTSAFSDVFLNILNKKLSESIVNSISSASSGAKDILADGLKAGAKEGTSGLKGLLSSSIGQALAVAGVGSIISGVTPKTSTIGQAAGGYLKGLGAGAAIGTSIAPGIGTLIGASLGGTIGLIGGIFGAKSAREKEAELQKQQLEELKKQTELARQQALAFTSSIIGRMTENGIITGVDVNSFGQLTATVSGKDLKFVLDRNGS